MAIFTGTFDGQKLPKFYKLDRRWLGVQTYRSRRGGQALGPPQEQAENELREIKSRIEILLRQKHNP